MAEKKTKKEVKEEVIEEEKKAVKKAAPKKAAPKKAAPKKAAPKKETTEIAAPKTAPAKKTPAKKTTKKEVPVKEEPKKEEPKKEEKKPVVEEQQPVEISIEQKLEALYTLQQVNSKIDKIRAYRGELPLEVQDLEDEVAGLETRIGHFMDDTKRLASEVANFKIRIKEAEALIKKYEDQQNNVRNNREYESISKEIEYQQLDIQLCEKKIKEATVKSEEIALKIEAAKQRLEERKADLAEKKDELQSIIEDTQKEEDALLIRSAECEGVIEDRLLVAYKRIRKNARNGLAVVGINRDACGGCFNKIPPQHQLDICTHKKIIVCEYCGRILVDKAIIDKYQE